MPLLAKALDPSYHNINKKNRSLNQKTNKSEILSQQKLSLLLNDSSSSVNMGKEIANRRLSIKNDLTKIKDFASNTVFYDRMETKKRLILSELPSKLDVPYKEEIKPKKKLSKKQRNDPLRKIILTNKYI